MSRTTKAYFTLSCFGPFILLFPNTFKWFDFTIFWFWALYVMNVVDFTIFWFWALRHECCWLYNFLILSVRHECCWLYNLLILSVTSWMLLTLQSFDLERYVMNVVDFTIFWFWALRHECYYRNKSCALNQVRYLRFYYLLLQK